MAKKQVGVKREFRHEFELLQARMQGVQPDIKREYFKQFYKSIAKAADQRLVNLERLSQKKGYSEVKEWAYANAMRDIRGSFGEGAKRFNRVQPNNLNSIYKNINRVLNFLEAPTSSKQGIDEIYEKRAGTIKTKYGVDMSWSKTATVFDTLLWKKVGQKYGSATALKSFGIIQANKKKIMRALKENKPISIIIPDEIDPETGQSKKDINIERTINKFLRYYKKDVKTLLSGKS